MPHMGPYVQLRCTIAAPLRCCETARYKKYASTPAWCCTVDSVCGIFVMRSHSVQRLERHQGLHGRVAIKAPRSGRLWALMLGPFPGSFRNTVVVGCPGIPGGAGSRGTQFGESVQGFGMLAPVGLGLEPRGWGALDPIFAVHAEGPPVVHVPHGRAPPAVDQPWGVVPQVVHYLRCRILQSLPGMIGLGPRCDRLLRPSRSKSDGLQA